MLSTIISALESIGVNTKGIMPEYHFSNYAVERVFAGPLDNYILLESSWEDSNVEMYDYARTTVADFIAGLAPGKFVVITTGDYISAPYEWGREPNLDTYDPRYHLLLVTKETFNKVRRELERIDTLWRNERQALADGKITPEQCQLDYPVTP